MTSNCKPTITFHIVLHKTALICNAMPPWLHCRLEIVQKVVIILKLLMNYWSSHNVISLYFHWSCTGPLISFENWWITSILWGIINHKNSSCKLASNSCNFAESVSIFCTTNHLIYAYKLYCWYNNLTVQITINLNHFIEQGYSICTQTSWLV